MNTNENKQKTAELVAARLRDDILSDKLLEGETVAQADIAKKFGVSRTPVRDALKILAGEGLVQITSTGRTLVTKVLPEEIQEIYEMRCQLEKWVLSLAIPVMTEEDFAAARECSELMRQCTESEWSELNARFHSILYRPANKPATLKLLNELSQTINLRANKPIYKVRNTARSLREHDELIDLCEKGDILTACDRLESHIIMNAHALIERLKAVHAKS